MADQNQTEYTPLTWVNDETKLSATNLNRLEMNVFLTHSLAEENKTYIDEICSALIDQIELTFDAANQAIQLSIGNPDSESGYYTPRFHVIKTANITSYYTSQFTQSLLDQKVDKEVGKVLTSNDFTNAYKSKLDGIATNAQVNVLEGVKVNGTLLEPNADKQVNIQTNHLVEKSSSPDVVYGTNFNGAQVTLPLDVSGTLGTIPTRDVNGQIIVPIAPTSGNQATSKSYVDQAAKSLVVTMDSNNYQLTFVLKDASNNPLSTQTVDLPLESVVVSGSYDDENEKIVLTLQSGSTIDIPVSDLIEGLVDSVNLQSTLSDYVAKSEVVDDLVSNDTDLPLSAKQGKVLKGLVDTKVETSAFQSALALKEDIITPGNGLKKENDNTLSSLIVASDVVINLD